MLREITQRKKLSDRVADGIDGFIGLFSPRLAFQRKRFRFASNFAFANRGGYRGADKNRINESWLPGSGSADEDILYDLELLRQRSRDLNRNNALSSGITGTLVNNVIGTGIKLQSRLSAEDLQIPEEEAAKTQKAQEKAFRLWSKKNLCDAGERLSFTEMQAQAFRQYLENGEAFAVRIMRDDAGRRYKTAWQMVESDRVATPFDKKSDKSIRSGIRVGSFGEAKSYFVLKTHPGETTLRSTLKSNQYDEIPAKNADGLPNVIHLYKQERPGQTRGVPIFASAIQKFKDMDDYLEAELVANRVAACFALLIKTMDPAGAADAQKTRQNTAGQSIQELEPGMVKYLGLNEEVQTFNPTRNNASFASFLELNMRVIGVGLGLPYEMVMKDFSKTNYSSARAALLQAYRVFRSMQQWVSEEFCHPIYQSVMDEVYLKNEFHAQNYFARRDEWTNAAWIMPGWAWVDPKKEVESAILSVKNNLSTLADEAGAVGKDYEEIIRQREREERILKDAGLTSPRDGQGPASDPEDEEEPEDPAPATPVPGQPEIVDISTVIASSRNPKPRSPRGKLKSKIDQLDGEFHDRITAAIRKKIRAG